MPCSIPGAIPRFCPLSLPQTDYCMVSLIISALVFGFGSVWLISRRKHHSRPSQFNDLLNQCRNSKDMSDGLTTVLSLWWESLHLERQSFSVLGRFYTGCCCGAAWCSAALPCGTVATWPFTQGAVCERQRHGCQRSKGRFCTGHVLFRQLAD